MLNYVNDPVAIEIRDLITQADLVIKKDNECIAWTRSLYPPEQNEAEELRLQIYQLQERLALLEAA